MIHWTLPDWHNKEFAKLPHIMKTDREKMGAVLSFARHNFTKNSGGPFAAGVFEKSSGKLITIGVNRVFPLKCSSAHAEVVALSFAQHLLGTYDLGSTKNQSYQLVVNWMTCSMCFGAVLWSGIRELIVAGTGDELEKITGFDEGPLPEDFREQLQKREISFKEGVMQDEAIQLFQDFKNSGSLVYNGRQTHLVETAPAS